MGFIIMRIMYYTLPNIQQIIYIRNYSYDIFSSTIYIEILRRFHFPPKIRYRFSLLTIFYHNIFDKNDVFFPPIF